MGYAIDNFHFLSLDEYLDLYKDDPTFDREKKKQEIEAFMEERDAGVGCDVCTNTPIWVIGSAACGWPGCFTCITGESDASEDYDVY